MKIFLRALALALVGAVSAHASINIVTGGDAGEGFAPLPLIYAAVVYGGTSAQTVQGVNFLTSNSNFTLGYSGPLYTYTTGMAVSGSSANDIALSSIASHQTYTGTGTLTLTIFGLDPTTTYQIDSLSGLQVNYSARTMNVTATGASTITDVMSGAQQLGDGNFYDFSQTLKPNASGVITLTYQITSGPPSPGISGVVVSSATASVPEPASALCCGLGALLLAGTRRRRPRVV
ncbi:MAG: hypothetical protein ACAI37_01880 [Chthoniobacter sp.]